MIEWWILSYTCQHISILWSPDFMDILNVIMYITCKTALVTIFHGLGFRGTRI